MEEGDSVFVEMMRSPDGALRDIRAVQALTRRLEMIAENNATVRNNFVIDNSTPHGDLVVSDNSALKPGIGWVTVHVTEALKSGVHEWGVCIENHGETSDGSGLMLGIVPKNYGRYDSFISQGGGWCLSRAGKFYGHWRRVDSNSSVTSLVFGTGDHVSFELDVEAARLTVRVGDKFVIGEISNLSGDVYPAISLHYRHQHVRFEYHKVRDRNSQRLTWIERCLFPAASVFLPLRPEHVDLVPLDSAVANPYSINVLRNNTKLEPCVLSFHGESIILSRMTIAAHAMEAVDRYTRTGLVLLEDFLSEAMSSELLRAPRLLKDSAKADMFGSNCSALLLVHMVSHLASNRNNDAVVMSACKSLSELVQSMPLHSLARGAAISDDILGVANEQLVKLVGQLLAEPTKPGGVHPPHLAAALELLVTLALQRGLISDVLQAARLLLNAAPVGEGVISPSLLSFVEFVSRSTKPRLLVDFDDLSQSVTTGSLPVVKEFKRADAMSVLSMACDQDFLYLHTTDGLAKHGTGSNGTAPRMYQSRRDPESITSCSYSSMALAHGMLFLRTSHMANNSVAFAAIDTKRLEVVRSFPTSEFDWWPPTSQFVSICTSDEAHILLLHWSKWAEAPKTPGFVHPLELLTKCEPCVWFRLVDMQSLLSTPSTPLSFVCSSLPRRYCLQMTKEASLDFGNPEGALSASQGHITVEFWIKWMGKDDSKVLYQHGDKALNGEVFIETHIADGALSLRGGCRHDRRPAATCTVSGIIPLNLLNDWIHCALSFDGRWRLYASGELLAINRIAAQSPSVDRPRGRWTAGNGFCWSDVRAPCVDSGAIPARHSARHAPLAGRE